MILGSRRRARVLAFATYSMLVLAAFYVLLPFAWVLATSFKTVPESLRIPITWWPEQPTLMNYVAMWQVKPFGQYFLSSTVISGATAVLSSLLGSFAAYGLSRFPVRGKMVFLGGFLATQMISGVLVIGPYFKIMAALGLYNTWTSLIIAFVTICLPFSTWMQKGYLDSLPIALDEQALIDGASRLRIFWQVILPLSMPGMVATTLFGFLLAWGDLLWAATLASTDDVRTVTQGIAFTVGEFIVEWPTLSAASAIGSVPSVLLYIFMQRYLVGGITAGAVKQ
jgi:multiple sugar transport system permease protein